MNSKQSCIIQLKLLCPVMLKIYVPIIILLLFLVIINIIYDIPVGLITRDPAYIMKAHPFVGLVSNIGVLFWCASATLCFLFRHSLSLNLTEDRGRYSCFLQAS